ncbi:MAG: sensor histidine kinase [Clostridiales bacterium]|nr:sensor histidine kinase [Clostridiales bacterium]
MDLEQMNRVFHNLIENSLKYARVNPVKIIISVKEENNRNIITIQDNGKGIESEKLPYLFEQFYRGDESRSQKNTDGNGLGLYIAKYIVEGHKGTISAENDHGFKILISLPKEDFNVL